MAKAFKEESNHGKIAIFSKKSIQTIAQQNTPPRPVLGIVMVFISFYVKNISYLVISYLMTKTFK